MTLHNVCFLAVGTLSAGALFFRICLGGSGDVSETMIALEYVRLFAVSGWAFALAGAGAIRRVGPVQATMRLALEVDARGFAATVFALLAGATYQVAMWHSGDYSAKFAWAASVCCVAAAVQSLLCVRSAKPAE